MTNEQIIHDACILDGITEPVHTFACWKSMGFMVKKGEHAKIKIPIWKHSSKSEVDDNGKEIDKSRMFIKTAAFFGMSQVDLIKESKGEKQ